MRIQATGKSLISRSATSVLKIFFETLVLFHHMYHPQTELGSIINGLIGPMGVAGFMFLSGYGVGVSFMKKGDGYLKSLAGKRIPRMYLTVVIADLFFLILFYLTGNTFPSAIALVSSVLYVPIFSGSTILSRWIYFMMDLAIYYAVFVLIAYLARKRQNRLAYTAGVMIGLEVILILVLTAVCNVTGNNVQMRACLLFPLGLLAANYEKAILPAVRKHKFAISAILLALAVFFIKYISFHLTREYVICGLLAGSVMALFVGVEINSKAVEVAGKHVVYVYLSHELFYKLMVYQMPNLHSVAVMATVFLCTIAVAVVAHRICKVKMINRPRLLSAETKGAIREYLADVLPKPVRKLKRAAST